MAGAARRPVRMDWKGRYDRPLIVPGELFTIYQPAIGGDATLAWLNLAYALQDVGVILDPVEELRQRQKLSREAAIAALERLEEAGLLDPTPEGGLILREPVVRGRLAYEAALQRDEEEDEPPLERPYGTASIEASFEAEEEPEREPAPVPARFPGTGGNGSTREALQAVAEFYQNRIGMLGPVQFEKLRFWVEEKAMSPDVVAAAIEETTASAEKPRIQYLEGILRNWYNDGIRSLQDLIKRNQLPAALAGAVPERAGGKRRGEEARAGSEGGPFRRRASRVPGAPETTRVEGMPNAAAYRKIDREAVARWKELYPDEYPEG